MGAKVSKGDVLAELAPLDTDALELALLRAQISLIQAKNPYTEREISSVKRAVDKAERDLAVVKVRK